MVGKYDLYCKIYEGLTFEEEATLFVELNTIQQRVSAAQKYKALVYAKETESLILENLCKEFGIVTMPKSSAEQPVLRGLRVSQTTIRLCGEGALRWIFEVIRDSQWHLVKGAYSELFIHSLRNIYRAHQMDLDTTKEKLCRLMQRFSFELLKAKANITFVGRGNQAAMFSLLESYLDGTKLPALE